MLVLTSLNQRSRTLTKTKAQPNAATATATATAPVPVPTTIEPLLTALTTKGWVSFPSSTKCIALHNSTYRNLRSATVSYGGVSCKLTLLPNLQIALHNLESRSTSKGGGSKFMNELLPTLDEVMPHVHIVLWASAFNSKRIPTASLIEWYSRLGFRITSEPPATDLTYMER